MIIIQWNLQILPRNWFEIRDYFDEVGDFYCLVFFEGSFDFAVEGVADFDGFGDIVAEVFVVVDLFVELF